MYFPSILSLLLFSYSYAQDGEELLKNSPVPGLITKPSPFAPSETIDRLSAILRSKGISVFARIDHSGNALKNGLDLRPTVVLLFGNPKLGTVLMQASQTIGIDLPMKALAWQDEKGKNWLGYNWPAYLQWRHSAGNSASVMQTLQKVAKALDRFTDAAIETPYHNKRQ